MRWILYMFALPVFVLSCSSLRGEKEQVVEESKLFLSLERAPKYPGSEEEMYKFLEENLVYPEDARNNYIEGRVIIRFLVKRDGTITDVEIVKGMDSMCDKEAVRVVQLMPKWIPPSGNYKPISTYFTIPIHFRLTKKTDEISNK